MNEDILQKILQLMAGIQIMQNITKNLIEATEKVTKMTVKHFSMPELLDSVYDDDSLDKELKHINSSIREVVETIVEVLDSCPVVGCEEVTKEEFTKLSADKSVQDMLDEIGLVINKGDDDEHK